MVTTTRRYLATRHGSLHVAIAGEGPPLLLLHSTPRSWRQFIPLLPHLAPRATLVMPDTLGFGASDPLPPRADFTMLAEATCDALDALGLDRLPVYGFHTGNKIAACLARLAPARVSGLMLSGQTHSLIPDKARRDEAIWQIVRKYYAGAGRDDDAADPLRRWAADFAVIAGTWMEPGALSDPVANQAHLGELERYAADFIACRHSLMPIYRANFAFDFAEAVAALAIPPHIVEFATPAEAHFGPQAEALAALCPGGGTTTFEKTGSNAHEIRAAEIAALILQHLAA